MIVARFCTWNNRREWDYSQNLNYDGGKVTEIDSWPSWLTQVLLVKFHNHCNPSWMLSHGYTITNMYHWQSAFTRRLPTLFNASILSCRRFDWPTITNFKLKRIKTRRHKLFQSVRVVVTITSRWITTQLISWQLSVFSDHSVYIMNLSIMFS